LIQHIRVPISLPVGTLPMRVQRFWSPSPTLDWEWQTGFSPCSSGARNGNGRLPTPVPRPGILCLTISETLILLYPLSHVILKPASSSQTSIRSAF